GRRVYELPPEARLLPVRLSEGAGAIAGAAVPRPGFRSSRAIAGGPIPPCTATTMYLGLPGRADRPPRSAEQVEDFLTTFRRLRHLRDRHSDLTDPNFTRDLVDAEDSFKRLVRVHWEKLCEFDELPRYAGRITVAEKAYKSLQQQARQADNDGNRERAAAIRKVMGDIDRHAAADLKNLCDTYGLAASTSAQEAPRMPATAAPNFDWCMVYRQLTSIRYYFFQAGQLDDAEHFRKVISRLEYQVRDRFRRYSGHTRQTAVLDTLRPGGCYKPEQRYRFLQNMDRRTERSPDSMEATFLSTAMADINRSAKEELIWLTRKYGPLETLAARAGLPPQRALLGATPMAAAAVSSGPSRPETLAAAIPTLAELLSQPPGPSFRVMPTQAPPTPTVPAPEVPLARREAIVERFRSDEALLYAGSTLGNCGADALEWTPARTERVIEDLHRLHSSAREDPAAAAALADIDWSSIEALTSMMDLPLLSA
ncbi:MAG: hypothetical protein OXE40_03525, partial [Gammaproteobacteria bacterium]|nr:hypothetical protein [Gammaproteobacteria bacterium]